MPHGKITKYEILSKVYKLKNELDYRDFSPEKREGADEYLNKVLDYISEFSY